MVLSRSVREQDDSATDDEKDDGDKSSETKIELKEEDDR